MTRLAICWTLRLTVFHRLGGLFRRDGAFLEHLQIPAGRRERRAQLVGYIGQEITPRHFLFGQFLVGLGQFAGAHAQVVDRHLVVFAQATADLADHGQRYTAAVLQDAVEGLFVDFQTNQGCQCLDGGSPRRVMDEGHFTEEIARCELLEQARLVIVDNFGDLNFPFQDQVERIFNLVFMTQDHPGG